MMKLSFAAKGYVYAAIVAAWVGLWIAAPCAAVYVLFHFIRKLW